MIDFHGRVLRLTRSTCADRSICFPFCTVLLLSRLFRPPNAIWLEAGPADDPGELQKRWGPGRSGPVPSANAIGA